MDVDCSSITYESKPSTIVLAAVNKTLESLEGKNTTEINLSDPSKPENQTISASPNATLTNSLLSFIEKDKASKDEIKEAFCRDIDSFSWEFGQPKRDRRISSGTRTVGSIVGIIIVKPKSSTKSKSEIQVPIPSPKFKIQSPEEREWDWG